MATSNGDVAGQSTVRASTNARLGDTDQSTGHARTFAPARVEPGDTTIDWGGLPCDHDGLASTLVADPEIGPSSPARTVGPYFLVSRLGGGSQGEVWRAFRMEPYFRSVALKILWPSVAIEHDRVERFRKEAERGGKLLDPALLPILDYGEDDRFAYIAMPLIEGFTLSQVITQRQACLKGETPNDLHRLAILPEVDYLRAIAAVLARIARGLEGAHREHIVHRDVKPSNILLDRERPERAFLSDFGLARDLDDATISSGRGEAGTPIYMAPEKLLGQGSIDEIRGDIYSFGVTLFESITCERPIKVPTGLHRSSWPALIAAAEPSRPRTIDPKIPRDLEAVTLKAMDRNPALRYASAAELADDLDRFVAGEPVLARPPGRVRRAWRRVRRHRRALLAAVAVALVVATALLVRRISHQITAAGASEARREARSLLGDGRIEEAGELAIRAHDRDPSHPDSARLVEDVTFALLGELRDASAYESPTRAWHALRVWRKLGSQNTNVGKAILAEFQLQRLDILVRPGALVAFHPLRPDGEPASGAPLYLRRSDPQSTSLTFEEVIPGPYWVTVSDPETGGFFERPFVVPRRTQPGTIPLDLSLRVPPSRNQNLVRIAGGTLQMGSDDPKLREAYPRHAVEVSAFEIDRTEVTSAQFEEFLGEHPRLDPIRRKLWGGGAPRDDRRDWPVTNVTYEEAMEFAAWRGCRLPTEAELEWVARGTVGRTAPPNSAPGWTPEGPAWSGLHGVWSEPLDAVETPRGTVFGLFGNASELTLLRYRPYVSVSGIRPFSSAWYGFTIRCGLVNTPETGQASLLSCLRRGSALPDQRNSLVGFRCARSLHPRVPLPTSLTVHSSRGVDR
jgi:eukaryotic-like serine/threonine-protein kinase